MTPTLQLEHEILSLQFCGWRDHNVFTKIFILFVYLFIQSQQFTYSPQQRLQQATTRAEVFHPTIPTQTIHALARGEQLEGFVPRNEEIMNGEGAITQDQAADILSPIQIIHPGALSLDDLPQQNSSSAPTYLTTTEVVAIKKGEQSVPSSFLSFVEINCGIAKEYSCVVWVKMPSCGVIYF